MYTVHLHSFNLQVNYIQQLTLDKQITVHHIMLYLFSTTLFDFLNYFVYYIQNRFLTIHNDASSYKIGKHICVVFAVSMLYASMKTLKIVSSYTVI